MNFIKKIYQKIRFSELAFHFKILAAGTIFSQVLMMISSPLITRLYSPEAFGIFALFLTILSLITRVIDAGYERAIVSAKQDQDGDDLFFLSIIITFLASLTLFSILFFFEETLKQFLNAKKLNLWWYAIPLGVLLHNLNKVIKSYANRFKNYKLIANISIFRSIIYVVIVISFGYLGFSSNGLFFAELLTSVLIIVFTVFFYKNFLIQLNYSCKERLLITAKKFISFPIYIIGPVILNNLSYSMPIFFLTKFYTESVVGYYFLALKIINFPVSFISSSISSLHLKKTSDLINQKKKVKPYFVKITLILTGVILIPLILLTLFGPELFVFVFGKNWKTAGEFAQIIMPSIALTFVVSSVCSVMIPAGKLNHYSIWSIVSFISISIFFYFFSTQLDIRQLLKYFTILNIGIYTFYFILIWNSVVKIDKKLVHK